MRRGMKPGRFALWLAVGVGLLLLGACSTHQELYPKVESLARQGQYDQAVKLIEKNAKEYGERNRVLFDMDRGVLLHYAGHYKESNAAFADAERKADDLYTESVSGNVGAFLTNDNTLPYPGEDFEVVQINLYRALNYVMLGQVDEALVEARKVNLKLEQINQRYDADKKNVYKEDAFARMLAGILYEMGGTRDDLNDAYISDRLAAESYKNDFLRRYKVPAPDPLKNNLIATAGFMGPEEVQSAEKRFPGVDPPSLAEKQRKGQIYVIHFAGKSPVKVEDAIRAIMPDGHRIKIAFPRYKPSFYTITGSRVRVGGLPPVTLEPAQPLGAIAMENLENRKGRIAAKAIARATTKYLATKALERQAGKRSDGARLFAFVAGSVYQEVSEQADLRSWRTLPDRVLIAQVLVDPGTYPVAVDLTARGGAVVGTRDLGTVEIGAGQTRFLIVHSLQ